MYDVSVPRFVARPRLAEALAATDPERVAVEVGVARSLLDRIVAGTAFPSSRLAADLGTALGVDPDELLEPHPEIVRVNRGRRLEDDALGLDVARLARR